MHATTNWLFFHLSSLNLRVMQKSHRLFVFCEETRSPSLPYMLGLYISCCLPKSPDAIDLPAADSRQVCNLRYRVELAQREDGLLEIRRDFFASHDGSVEEGHVRSQLINTHVLSSLVAALHC
jgi:hypothetical protein